MQPLLPRTKRSDTLYNVEGVGMRNAVRSRIVGGPLTGSAAMLDHLRRLFTVSDRSGRIQNQLDALRDRLPVPVFWLFGKTQSGKTSVVKYLTGAERAEIGTGYKPCTRFSQRYEFPTE